MDVCSAVVCRHWRNHKIPSHKRERGGVVGLHFVSLRRGSSVAMHCAESHSDSSGQVSHSTTFCISVWSHFHASSNGCATFHSREMVEVDYAANGRRSLDRVKHAAAHLKNFFDADTKVRNITADRITAYQAARLKQPEREGEPRAASPSTTNYELAVLRRAFRLGARAGKVAARPETQMLHVENARKGFFEPEQHRAVVNHLPDYLKPVALVAYITGWRTKSELLTRQWRHVDFANGWLRLDPGESKNGEGREFPFTPELLSVLQGSGKL